MDFLGLLNGNVEKNLRKLSSDDISVEKTNQDIPNDETKEVMLEKREKMLKEQARRRGDRAKAREEIRLRHKIQSSELDKEYIENAPKQTIFDAEVSERPAKIASMVVGKFQATWLQVKERFNDE